MFAKSKTYRSRHLLDFIKTLPCCISGRVGDTDPHHITSGGMGMKGDDRLTIPLSRAIHREYHSIGRTTFEARYGVLLDKLALDALMQYVKFLEEKWIV